MTQGYDLVVKYEDGSEDVLFSGLHLGYLRTLRRKLVMGEIPEKNPEKPGINNIARDVREAIDKMDDNKSVDDYNIIHSQTGDKRA